MEGQKEMLTKRHVIAVGGKTEEAKDEPKQVDRLKNKQEPFCFWGSPLELYEEYLHTFFAKMVLGFDPKRCQVCVCMLAQQSRLRWVGLQPIPCGENGRALVAAGGEGNAGLQQPPLQHRVLKGTERRRG